MDALQANPASLQVVQDMGSCPDLSETFFHVSWTCCCAEESENAQLYQNLNLSNCHKKTLEAPTTKETQSKDEAPCNFPAVGLTCPPGNCSCLDNWQQRWAWWCKLGGTCLLEPMKSCLFPADGNVQGIWRHRGGSWSDWFSCSETSGGDFSSKGPADWSRGTQGKKMSVIR